MKIDMRNKILEVTVEDMYEFMESVSSSDLPFSHQNFVESQFIVQGYDSKRIAKDYKVIVSPESTNTKMQLALQDFTNEIRKVINLF